jgi:hypothetical protein
MILMGIAELAVVLRSLVVLNNANREAARYASQGTYSDEQVAERALASFAGQLEKPSEKTSIIVSHFYIPAGDRLSEEELPEPSSVYNLGIGRPSRVKTVSNPAGQEIKILSDNQTFHTDHHVVVIETYYEQDPLFIVPLLPEFAFIPDTWDLYVRTAMRVTSRHAEQ